MDTYRMPEARVGDKWTSDYRPTKNIAADIRADIKAAKKAGELPADLKASVKTRLFAGGSAIDVSLSGWTMTMVYALSEDGYMKQTPAAQEVLRKVEAIRGAYNRNASDSMVDYFEVTYYGSTNWDWRIRAV